MAMQLFGCAKRSSARSTRSAAAASTSSAQVLAATAPSPFTSSSVRDVPGVVTMASMAREAPGAGALLASAAAAERERLRELLASPGPGATGPILSYCSAAVAFGVADEGTTEEPSSMASSKASSKSSSQSSTELARADKRPSEDTNAPKSFVVRAAATAVSSGDSYAPRTQCNLSAGKIAKLRRQAYGGKLDSWLAYERLLRVCEPWHFWRWVPDKSISEFWRSLAADRQAAVTEVKSQGFRDLIKEHISMTTCFVKDLMGLCNEVHMLDDTDSIAVYREFFRIAVEENVCMAMNWQTVQTVDSTVQDFIKSTMKVCVDPREFPKGSMLWCQYREREHARLTIMCLMLEIFERRLLGMWEREHGSPRRRAAERLAAELLAEEGDDGDDLEEELGADGEPFRAKKKKTSKRERRRRAAAKEAEDRIGCFSKGKSCLSGGVDPDLAEELKIAQARVEAGDGDEIDAEFNRLVLEHLKSRAAAAEEQTVNEERSASVLKKLCTKLEKSLQATLETSQGSEGASATGGEDAQGAPELAAAKALT